MSSTDKVAIVTGSAQGIGLAISKALLEKGYKVCLSDVNDQKGEESLKDLQKLFGVDRVIYKRCDVTTEQQYHELFSETLKNFGRVDVLVNNAGISDLLEATLMVKVNLLGPIYGCQTALKYMSKANGGEGGVVVNVASLGGILSGFNNPAYIASKHGVIGLTRDYGKDYCFNESGILFMAMCPHYTRTELIMKRFNDAITRFPDIMEPEFVATGVIKLLEDKINGSTMVVLPGKLKYARHHEKLEDLFAD